MIIYLYPNSGGIGTYARRCVSELESQGARVDALEVEEESGLPRYIASLLRRKIARYPVRAIHLEIGSNSRTTLCVGLVAKLLFARTPLVATIHDVPGIIRNPAVGLLRTRAGLRDRIAYSIVAPVFDRAVLSLFRRGVKSVIVLTDQSVVQLVRQGWPDVRLLAHPAEVVPQEPAEVTRGRYVVLPGYIGPQKGLDTFEQAWRKLIHNDVEVRIVGSASRQNQAWAEETISRLTRTSHSAVYWLSDADDQAFDEAIRLSELVILPYSSANPASGVLMKALSMGKAVVGSRVDALLEEIDDGVNGVLVPPGDPDKLAEAIDGLLSDACARMELGRRAALGLRGRTWSAHAAELQKVFREVN